MSAKDPYEILGVARTASADEIKRAYRRLAKQFHPDHNPGDKSAERRFKEVQAAYEVLGDADRRQQYDRFGAGGPRPHFEQWSAGGAGGMPGGASVNFGGFGDLADIFEQFFNRGGGAVGGAARARGGRRGGGATTRPRATGENVEHELAISFNEAARGAKRQIELSDGGAVPERIEVRIPAGIEDGQRIRLAGRGQAGPGGRGDLFIRCRVTPHAYFRREGRDVLLDLPLTVPEAISGARVDIPTLDGVMRLTVPPGASSGTRLRLRGKGAGDPHGGEMGDMYAVIRIVVPRDATEALRAWVTEHAAEFGGNPRAGLGWTI